MRLHERKRGETLFLRLNIDNLLIIRFLYLNRRPITLGRLMLLRRFYQTHAHPHLFRQTVQLTDGSTIRVVSLSNVRPFLRVGVDSFTHPSWNPQLRTQMQLSEHGEVAKFKERFGQVDDSTLSAFDGMFEASEPVRKRTAANPKTSIVKGGKK